MVQDTELQAIDGSNSWSGAKGISTFHTTSNKDNLSVPTRALQDIKKRPARKYLSGWRSGVTLCVLLGVSIFFLNLGITIWALTGVRIVKGVATVYEGSCAQTKSSLTWLHAINVLSSLLLGASNFCMQILSAPTRKEIDAAHARRKWLSIGVPSLKNLFYIDRKKGALWILLGLSSIPLHLLWNSVVADTLSTNTYIYSAVTEDFLRGTPWNSTTFLTHYPEEAIRLLERIRDNFFVNMSISECIHTYSADYVSEYGNLVLVYDIEGYNNSLMVEGINGETSTYHRSMPNYNSYTIGGTWMCGAQPGEYTCDFGRLMQENATHWNPWEANSGYGTFEPSSLFYIEGNVKYCLAEETDRLCRLGISPPVLITVLVCNAVKSICFVLTLWIGGSMHPLVTNGDAVESFLLQPDLRLKGRCLASKADVKNNKRCFWSDQPLPLQWRSKRLHWTVGATKSRWLETFIPYELLGHSTEGLALADFFVVL